MTGKEFFVLPLGWPARTVASHWQVICLRREYGQLSYRLPISLFESFPTLLGRFLA